MVYWWRILVALKGGILIVLLLGGLLFFETLYVGSVLFLLGEDDW